VNDYLSFLLLPLSKVTVQLVAGRGEVTPHGVRAGLLFPGDAAKVRSLLRLYLDLRIAF